MDGKKHIESASQLSDVAPTFARPSFTNGQLEVGRVKKKPELASIAGANALIVKAKKRRISLDCKLTVCSPRL